MEAKPEKPINGLPSPNANAYPTSQKDNPPGRKQPADRTKRSAYEEMNEH